MRRKRKLGGIATIGYESVSLAAFVGALRANQITILLDVRDYPISRRRGFSKKVLGTAVNAAGIEYQHIKELGNPKQGRVAAREGRLADFRRIFSRRLATKAAQLRLREIAELARNETICLMCYERDYLECHRLLVAERISARNSVPVTHLVVRSEDRLRSPELDQTPVAL